MEKINNKLKKANKDFDTSLMEILNEIKDIYTQKKISDVTIQELIVREKIKSDIHIGEMKQHLDYKKGYQLFFKLEQSDVSLKFYFSGKVELDIVCSNHFFKKESKAWKRENVDLNLILKNLDNILLGNNKILDKRVDKISK